MSLLCGQTLCPCYVDRLGVPFRCTYSMSLLGEQTLCPYFFTCLNGVPFQLADVVFLSSWHTWCPFSVGRHCALFQLADYQFLSSWQICVHFRLEYFVSPISVGRLFHFSVWVSRSGVPFWLADYVSLSVWQALSIFSNSFPSFQYICYVFFFKSLCASHASDLVQYGFCSW